jgi:hypothetical protein
VIFAATSVVTLLGVTNVIVIREGYLTALITAFLIELAGAVTAIFKSANFFVEDPKPLNAEADIRNSIRKLDGGIGLLHRRIQDQEILFQARLLGIQHLRATPETDTMVLISSIKSSIGKVSPDVINSALGSIADIIESKVRLGSINRAQLITLIKSLPDEASGQGDRILQLIQNKEVQQDAPSNGG